MKRDYQERLYDLLQELPRSLKDHTQRVRSEAVILATKYGVDLHKVDLAASAHDLARLMDSEHMLQQIETMGLAINRVERSLPVLLHGAIAAAMIKQRFGIEDEEVLEAVHWHTTGHPGFGPVAKVVFLADKLDYCKKTRYPFSDEVRKAAEEDLDKGLFIFMTRELERLLKQNSLIHPALVEARNELLLQV